MPSDVNRGEVTVGGVGFASRSGRWLVLALAVGACPAQAAPLSQAPPQKNTHNPQ